MTTWIILIAVTAVLLLIDLVLVRGRGGTMSSRQAAIASAAWVAAAFACAGVFWAFRGSADASAFVAGYLVEKALSLDNVFVFLMIFAAFALPLEVRHRLLTFGIIGALVLRAGVIVLGAAALQRFNWMTWIFAAILVWTGWKLWRHRHDHDSERALVAGLQRRLPIAQTAPDDRRLVVRSGGRRMLTVGGAALVAIAFVDLLFAVDSVPAILAITDDTAIVFAANAFALLGLRPLFFLVSDLVERLYYLKAALAVLLVVIGAKMIAAEFVGKIGPAYSLTAIAAVLGAGIIASIVRERRVGRAALGS